MVNTAVIVQARWGSSRLPGKVLLDLCGRTVLAHVLERCLAIASADVVVCAVPDSPQCDSVAAEALAAGVLVFRGSETDVLSRYHGAAQMVGAATVLRVTSDCPLIDPFVCDAVLELGRRTQADYACNNMPSSWPHGLDCEAFTQQWLARANNEAQAPFDREHVTPYIRNHPDATKANLANPAGYQGDARWTVDWPEDLEAVRAIVAKLPAGPAGWRHQAVQEVIASNPQIADINAHRRQAAHA